MSSGSRPSRAVPHVARSSERITGQVSGLSHVAVSPCETRHDAGVAGPALRDSSSDDARRDLREALAWLCDALRRTGARPFGTPAPLGTTAEISAGVRPGTGRRHSHPNLALDLLMLWLV